MRLRHTLLAVVGIIAVAAAIGVVATHIDRPVSVNLEARVAVATSSVPVWTPTMTATWTQPPTLRYWTPATTQPTTTAPAPVPVGEVLPPTGSVIMRGDS